jgi:hypothetical protein
MPMLCCAALLEQPHYLLVSDICISSNPHLKNTCRKQEKICPYLT